MKTLKIGKTQSGMWLGEIRDAQGTIESLTIQVELYEVLSWARGEGMNSFGLDHLNLEG